MIKYLVFLIRAAEVALKIEPKKVVKKIFTELWYWIVDFRGEP